MRVVNTDKLNRFWKNGVLAIVDALSKKIDVLDTKEEIEANTDEEKMAGALAVKEMFGQLNSKLVWKSAGAITNKSVLPFPDDAQEFQIVCAHGSFRHIMPFNRNNIPTNGSLVLATSFTVYMNNQFYDLYFSFSYNSSGIYVNLVTRNEAQTSDYICNLFWR